MILIQCVDNTFHTDPVWYGTLNNDRAWVIRPEDGLMYVSIALKTKSETGWLPLIKKLCEDFPIKKLQTGQACDMILFKDQMIPGVKYEIEILGPMPTPNQSVAMSSYPRLDDLRWCWEVEFPTEEVIKFFSPGHVDQKLLGFILGSKRPWPITTQLVKKARLLIQKQVDLRGVSIIQAKQRFGDHILLKRRSNVLLECQNTSTGESGTSDG